MCIHLEINNSLTIQQHTMNTNFLAYIKEETLEELLEIGLKRERELLQLQQENNVCSNELVKVIRPFRKYKPENDNITTFKFVKRQIKSD
jgi:hypothetical protein